MPKEVVTKPSNATNPFEPSNPFEDQSAIATNPFGDAPLSEPSMPAVDPQEPKKPPIWKKVSSAFGIKGGEAGKPVQSSPKLGAALDSFMDKYNKKHEWKKSLGLKSPTADHGPNISGGANKSRSGSIVTGRPADPGPAAAASVSNSAVDSNPFGHVVLGIEEENWDMAEVARLAGELGDMVHLPIRCDHNFEIDKIIPHVHKSLPLSEAAEVMRRSQEIVHFFRKTPTAQLHPNLQGLVAVYKQMWDALDVQVEKAAADLPLLRWDVAEKRPILEAHVAGLVKLSSAIADCCNKCSRALARTLLTNYAQKFADGKNLLSTADQRFPDYWAIVEDFNSRYREPLAASDWSVSVEIARVFCLITSMHLTEELEQYFPMGGSPGAKDGSAAALAEEEAKITYMLHAMRAAATFELQLVDSLKEEGIATQAFEYILTRVFTPYLQRFVASERVRIQGVVRVATDLPAAFKNTVDPQVFAGSVEIFEAVMQSITTLHEINQEDLAPELFAQAFRSALLQYEDMLMQCLQLANHAGLRTTCIVANTAQHCNGMTIALEEALPCLGDEQRDSLRQMFTIAQFQAVSSCVAVATASVSHILEKVQQVSLGWQVTASMGGCSIHVTELTEAITGEEGIANVFNSCLTTDSFEHVIVLFVGNVIRGYRKQILACKNLSMPAIDQLMMDSGVLQGLLMSLTTQGSAVEDAALKEMQEVMGILEVMQSPQDTLVDTFIQRVGTNENDFTRLLGTLETIKGLNKSQSQRAKAALTSQFLELSGVSDGRPIEGSVMAAAKAPGRLLGFLR